MRRLRLGCRSHRCPTARLLRRHPGPDLRRADRGHHQDLEVWDGSSRPARSPCTSRRRRLTEVCALSPREHKAIYVSRKLADVERKGREGGNLNFLRRARVELLVLADADQCRIRTSCRRSAGLHSFRAARSCSQAVVPGSEGDLFFNEDRVFYGACSSRWTATTPSSRGSAVFFTGRAALDDIGGFATWNLVEGPDDVVPLRARLEVVSTVRARRTGSRPDDIWGVMKQRGQWLFRHHAHLLLRQPACSPGPAAQALQLLP